MPSITRRDVLKSIPAAVAAGSFLGGSALGQAKRQLPVRSLSHCTLTVTDLKRSVDWYQGLFGMGITARQGTAPSLQIGSGVEFLFFAGGQANAKPGFNHFCMAMDHFVLADALSILEENGVSKADASGGIAGGAMKYRVRMRPPNLGGAEPNGTAELYIGDPDGLSVQLQDSTYCGGGGQLGEICYAKPEPAPKPGLLHLEDLSHFTLFVSDATRSLKFYQDIFKMPISGHQGATPLLGLEHGQFLTIAGGANRPPEINHVSFRMKGFSQDKVFKALSDYGLKPRPEDQPAGQPVAPLQYYVSLRMPNRGGAPGGTPELYLTDPDGILLQIQDTSYCGGGGPLGEICGG
jgi:catechol 2,3-dioxygenase-like lactoylglutathione lyase family enzyme